MDLSIVIPCYNEADNVDKIQTELFPVVNALAESRTVEVIFVDDGSRDDTYKIFSAAFGACHYPGVTIRFEQHEVNRGLGAAIRTGFAAATGDIIVTTDSDGTYRFSEIPTLLSYLTPEVDMVTASPYHPRGGIAGVPAYRLALSKGASAMYRVLADWQIHTYTALFRAYRRYVTEDVPFESNGFLGGTELMINAIRMGYRVAEYPTVLYSRVHGTSKAKLARTIKSHLLFQLFVVMPWHPYGMLLQGSDECVYLYTDFQKRLFPSPEIFLSHGYHWEQVVKVSDKYLAQLVSGPPMPFKDGTLLKSPDNTIFFIEHGKKRPFLSAPVFEGLGYQWKHVLPVKDTVLDAVESGDEINLLGSHPDGTLLSTANDKTVFLLENGKKHPFNTKQAFLSWGYKWDQVVKVSPAELEQYPLGPSIAPQKSFFQERGQLTSLQPEATHKPRKLTELGSALYWGLTRQTAQFKLRF